MLILAVDTAGEVCSVALSEGKTVRGVYRFRHNRHLVERIPAVVEFVLGDFGATLADVEAFVAGLGPGSFTGVRVGVTMAKMWAFARNKPVVGISSLDALALPFAGFARCNSRCHADTPHRVHCRLLRWFLIPPLHRRG